MQLLYCCYSLMMNLDRLERVGEDVEDEGT